MPGVNPLVAGLWRDLGDPRAEYGAVRLKEEHRRPLDMVIYQLVLGTVMRASLHLASPKFGDKEVPADIPTSLSHCWYQGLDEALEEETKRDVPPLE